MKLKRLGVNSGRLFDLESIMLNMMMTTMYGERYMRKMTRKKKRREKKMTTLN